MNTEHIWIYVEDGDLGSHWYCALCKLKRASWYGLDKHSTCPKAVRKK